MVGGTLQLRLPGSVREALVQHALMGAPDEVCGILAGHGTEVERLERVRNTADEIAASTATFRDRASGAPAGGRKAVHYYMDPRDLLRVYNALDDARLDVVAYYHSHTHTEARPSPTDIRLATDLVSLYVLVGLENAASPSVRAWRIVKDDPASEEGTLIEVPVVP